jgi:hypothetical protein
MMFGLRPRWEIMDHDASHITQNLPKNQCIFVRGYRVFPFPDLRLKLKAAPGHEPDERPEFAGVPDGAKVSTPSDPLPSYF